MVRTVSEPLTPPGDLPPIPPQRPAQRRHLTIRHFLFTLAVLAALLAVTAAVAVTLGSERIPLAELWDALRGRPLSPEHQTILFELRLPRLALAIVVGAGLAVAGAAFQALLRNPLAEPYVLGVSSGASLGAVAAIMFAAAVPYSRPFFAFGGAALTTLVVYQLGRGRAGESSDKLILAGVITTSFLSAANIFLTMLASSVQLRGITFWLLGDLSLGGGDLLPALSIIVLGATVGIYWNARSLNLLMVGERDALALGVEVGRVRFVIFTLASLITGVVVAVGGSVGYVGLIVPHIIRLAFGTDYRLLIPAAMLGGSILVLAADTVARTAVAPRELPVGAVLAMIGAPLFIYLLRRTN